MCDRLAYFWKDSEVKLPHSNSMSGYSRKIHSIKSHFISFTVLKKQTWSVLKFFCMYIKWVQNGQPKVDDV